MSQAPPADFQMPEPIPIVSCPTCEGRGALFPARAGRPAPCARCSGAGTVKRPHPCANCGRTINGELEASYACGLEPGWHCADCHFGDHGRPAPAEEVPG